MAKVFVAVGVGPGVGLAIARRFASSGFDVALVARRADALEALATDVGGGGVKAQPFTADAADTASVKRALATIAAQMGPPEVLVYNAAVATPGVPSSFDPEQMVRDFRVNVVGALAAAQAVIPAMRAAKRGTILFTGGGFAIEPIPMMASLGIGKAGIRNLALSLAKELEPDGIHVNRRVGKGRDAIRSSRHRGGVLEVAHPASRPVPARVDISPDDVNPRISGEEGQCASRASELW
jgi:short-subunit dehydrogenase